MLCIEREQAILTKRRVSVDCDNSHSSTSIFSLVSSNFQVRYYLANKH